MPQNQTKPNQNLLGPCLWLKKIGLKIVCIPKDSMQKNDTI